MFDRNGLFSKNEPRKDSKQPQPAAPANQRPSEPARTETPAAAPAPSTLSRSADGKGSKLIVGPDIKLKGVEITDCDTLVVEGRVEASMDSRVIQIAEEGVFHGTAGIDVAEINGRFEGELTARKQLVIRATGKVTGKIRYGKLTIEEGGELTGDVGTLTAGDSYARKEQSQSSQSSYRPAKSLAGMV